MRMLSNFNSDLRCWSNNRMRSWHWNSSASYGYYHAVFADDAIMSCFTGWLWSHWRSRI